MPTALIHCFSGTGNSRLAAELFADGLEKLGYSTALRSMEDGLYPGGDAVDMHIFFFPVYATALPHIVARYLLRLPKGRGARAAVFSTNGRISARFRDGYQGWALHQARLLLKLRGYDAFRSDTFDMPHNVTAFGPPCRDESCRKLMEMTAPKIAEAARGAVAGERRHRKIFLLNFIWCVPFGLLLSWIGRRAIGKLYSSGGKCKACGLCAKKCPVGNIKMKGKRVWFGWRCEGCMRCINVCPKQAIQFSTVRVAAIVFASVWNPLIAFGVYKMGFLAGVIGGFGAFVADLLIMLAVTFVLFNVFDWIIFLLGFVPGVRRVLAWGHTTLYCRYDSRVLKSTNDSLRTPYPPLSATKEQTQGGMSPAGDRGDIF
jgi:ferredoxin